jgi:toxin CptA
MASSRTSSTCRIEWRPSRWRCAALVLIGLLAGASVLLSDAPAPLAWLLAVVLPAHAGRLAWRDGQEAPATLVWRHGQSEAVLIGPKGAQTRLSSLNLRWRGPLATLGARDEAGKLRRLSWWPDTLPPPARRVLRLVAEASTRDAGIGAARAGAASGAGRAAITLST